MNNIPIQQLVVVYEVDPGRSRRLIADCWRQVTAAAAPQVGDVVYLWQGAGTDELVDDDALPEPVVKKVGWSHDHGTCHVIIQVDVPAYTDEPWRAVLEAHGFMIASPADVPDLPPRLPLP